LKWLIVGLGNPGSKYDNTPHNLGFEVADAMADRQHLNWQDAKKFHCVAASGATSGGKLYLIKPLTFMNLSGQAVQAFANYYDIEPNNILVVCDDVNLPWGKMRLREKGSDGGHNGLKDIKKCLGTDQYCRLRVGCAPEKQVNMVSYVLGNIGKKEREVADQVVDKSCDCIEEWILSGPQKAMAIFNGWDGSKVL